MNRDGVPVEEAEPDLYRLTVDQFERMAEAGVFPPEDRVELINGVLVEMSPIGDGRVFVVGKLHYELGRRLDGHAAIFDQSSFDCGDASLPQPDLVIVPWPYERYATQRPSADVALVVIEVANSLPYDQQVKVPLYARSGVPEVWVVDLPHRRIHVYTDPKDDGYATTSVLTQKDALTPIALPDVEIPVSDLGLNLLR
jgi:Uma2 family endonuclease